jgi:hypothetical protein
MHDEYDDVLDGLMHATHLTGWYLLENCVNSITMSVSKRKSITMSVFLRKNPSPTGLVM